MSAFDNATLMITGGTGSFGSTVLKHFLDSDLKEIRIFSRDEKKQDDMRHELQAKHPEAAKKVKFYIGDVRNPQSIRDAMPGVDYIFHAAALKQVPSCEFSRCRLFRPISSAQTMSCMLLLTQALSVWSACLRIRQLILSMPWVSPRL